MKKRFGREMIWLSLPLVIIGGAAWIFGGGGRVLLPAKLDDGPLRLEWAPFKRAKVTPAEVYEGFDWAVRTSVQEHGHLHVPSLLRPVGSSAPRAYTRLVYRVGKVWKQAPDMDSKGWVVIRNVVESNTNNVADNTLKLMVNLEKVPRDAKEIRLKGYIEVERAYNGALPAGWEPPLGWVDDGQVQSFPLKTKPFDLSIQAPGEARPAPHVSRACATLKQQTGDYQTLAAR